MKIRRIIQQTLLLASLLTAILICHGCEEVFDYHPYDAKVTGETKINIKNIKRIENICAGKTTVTFAVISDSHKNYDEEEKLVKALNKIDSLDFVIHGGDISEYGVTEEFIWHRDTLSKLSRPYVALIGNHDCLGNGQDVFETIWGDTNFSFTAGNIEFVCLNTNAFEYDYSHNIPDFNYIESEASDSIESGVDKHIVVMHAKPYCEQFNNNVAKPFEYYIKQLKNLQFCINGHNHKVEVDDVFNDGVIYYGCPNVGSRQFLLFTISPNSYTYNVVSF